MNIFVLDKDPVIAASYMCDKHILKMCLESAQMLCVAVSEVQAYSPYKLTHRNHPCTKWAGASKQNAEWLLTHLSAILDEYERRYGKIHKIRRDGLESFFQSHIGKLPDVGLTAFAIAVAEDCKLPGPVESYRKFYEVHKSSFAKWKNGTPSWYRPQRLSEV